MADDVGSLLLRAGLVDTDQLDGARAAANTHGGTVPEELVRLGYMGDEDLTSFARSRLLVPRVKPSELTRLSARLLDKVPADMAAEFRSIPVAIDTEGNLTVIMSDPSDTKAAEEISFFTGSYVMRAVATQAQIAWCLAHYYKEETNFYRELVADGTWPSGPEGKQNNVGTEGDTAPIKKRRKSRATERDPDVPTGAESEESTGPLKTRKRLRPDNQHPSPPELFARSGEISSVHRPDHRIEHEPGVQVYLEPEPEPAAPGVVLEEQRGTDTAPILLSTIKQSEISGKQSETSGKQSETSGPILLQKPTHKKRRSRQTHLGVGAGDGSKASSSPIQQALVDRAEQQLEGDNEPSESFLDSEEVERIADFVGGGWGAPGTTIPPSYLGPQPQEYEQIEFVEESLPPGESLPLEESIPVAIETDATVRSDAPEFIPEHEPQHSSATGLATQLLVALRAIDSATDKRGVLEPMLDFLDQSFERTGFLALRQNDLTTWLLHGSIIEGRCSVTIDEESIFRDVVQSQVSYHGPPKDAISRGFAQALGAPMSDDQAASLEILAVAVTIRDRIVGVLFGLERHDVFSEEHLVVLSQAAAEALERILLARHK